MNCHEAEALIAAHADGEADWRQGHALELHLRGCAGCTARRDALLALRAQLRREAPYHGAPPALRARLAAACADVAPLPQRRPAAWREHWRWLAGGAAAGCAATVLAWMVATALIAGRAGDDYAAEAVASHVRATLGDHLMQVASTDRHTVKPWLSARLDYSPPVRDFDGEGFPLAGARIEMLAQRPVATLVYRHRLHVIDVFVRPESGRPALPPARSVRGFNVARATGSGMEWTAVSDVDADVLAGFVARLAGGD